MANEDIFSVAFAIMILLGTGGYVMVENNFNDFEPNYMCTDKKIIMYCDRLSGSGNRCYPTDTTTKGYKDCKTGWDIIEPKQDPSSGYPSLPSGELLQETCGVNKACELI